MKRHETRNLETNERLQWISWIWNGCVVLFEAFLFGGKECKRNDLPSFQKPSWSFAPSADVVDIVANPTCSYQHFWICPIEKGLSGAQQ